MHIIKHTLFFIFILNCHYLYWDKHSALISLLKSVVWRCDNPWFCRFLLCTFYWDLTFACFFFFPFRYILMNTFTWVLLCNFCQVWCSLMKCLNVYCVELCFATFISDVFRVVFLFFSFFFLEGLSYDGRFLIPPAPQFYITWNSAFIFYFFFLVHWGYVVYFGLQWWLFGKLIANLILTFWPGYQL